MLRRQKHHWNLCDSSFIIFLIPLREIELQNVSVSDIVLVIVLCEIVGLLVKILTAEDK